MLEGIGEVDAGATGIETLKQGVAAVFAHPAARSGKQAGDDQCDMVRRQTQ